MTTTKIALITGGSRGLGKNTALALSKKGFDVIITYHSNLDAANKTIKEIEANGQKAAALQLDASQVSTFKEFKSNLESILRSTWDTTHFDALVNNAGIGIHSMIGTTTEEQFDALSNVHFKGVYFLTQELLPLLKDGGSIVNLSSGLARFALPGYAAYGSMKAAIEMLTIYMAKELGQRQINVNVVAPGAIDTDFNKAALENNPGMRDFIGSVTALGRIGEADDIGGVVAFLCTEEASWINGQRIEASGGMFL